jgi:hypothetical protein
MAPERNDVIYGMSPQLYDFYMDYHARETYHVVVQELDVSPGQAAALIELVEAYGPVPPAQCSAAVSSVLRQVPGFEAMSRNLFPTRTMAQFATIPGVRERRIYDDDSDDNYELLNAQAAAAARLEAGVCCRELTATLASNEKPPWPCRGGDPFTLTENSASGSHVDGGSQRRPSRCAFLRASLRARRMASAFSRAFFSDGFS